MALIQIPDKNRGQWITQVAVELSSGTPTMDFTKQLFSEAEAYRAAASERSRLAGLASAAKRQRKSTDVQPPSTDVQQTFNDSQPIKQLAVSSTETKDLKACSGASINLETEKRIRQCVADKSEFITANYPHINIPAETEEMVAKYRSGTIGADPWLMVLRWVKNVKIPEVPIPGYVYGRDPKPAYGTDNYKIWQKEYARACQ